MSEVLVIGHRNPDTDAICSAIGYAEFKRRTGMIEAVAQSITNEFDSVNDVAFATTIRPNYRSYAGLKVKFGMLGERLEADYV